MTEHNVTEVMLIAILILCLIAGPFVQYLWHRRGEFRRLPERREQLQEAAKALSTWLNEGKGTELLRVEGMDNKMKFEVVDTNHAALDNWLKRAPFISVRKGETLFPGEREYLDSLFRAVYIYLFTLGAAAALAITFELRQQTVNRLAICCLGGLFGGCVAAFRSCLDRRANGFEDKYGNSSPEPEVRKGQFGDGMAQWFLGRPILSAGVGLLLYFALEGEVFPKALADELSEKDVRLVFYACLAGLLAKTLLDLFLEAGKKIFRVEKE